MNAVPLALDSILEKKGRSLLTMLGIIIGVTAVLVLVAVVSGYNADLTAYYEKMGVNKVNVTITWYDQSRATDLTDALYAYGNTELGGMVTGVSPSTTLSSANVKHRTTTLDTTSVYLGGDQWSLCNNYTLDQGRDILGYDIEKRSNVCVIGSYVAQSLFQYSDPIGQVLLLNGSPFTVVGTFYQKDGSAEESMDDAVVLPYSLNRALLNTGYVTGYTVKVGRSDDMSAVIVGVEDWLSEHVDSAVGTYSVENGNAAMTASNEETASLSAVLGGIASIALLVGGIGIMNIMLVTVTERTREIGIKKAIGAPRREIITQFLVEAGILSGLGGVIGILLGYAISVVLGKALYDLILTPGLLITIGAFVFSVGIGLIFGIYPAVKASNLQPVDALRAD